MQILGRDFFLSPSNSEDTPIVRRTHTHKYKEIQPEDAYVLLLTHTHKTDVMVPFLEVRVVLWVVLVTSLLQCVVEVKGIFFININWGEVCSSTKPPLFRAWKNTHTHTKRRKKDTQLINHQHAQ